MREPVQTNVTPAAITTATEAAAAPASLVLPLPPTGELGTTVSVEVARTACYTAGPAGSSRVQPRRLDRQLRCTVTSRITSLEQRHTEEESRFSTRQAEPEQAADHRIVSWSGDVMCSSSRR
jgi:hypothetical protein